MKIETFQDTGGLWRFRFVASNGKIVASSQGYKKKASCVKGISAAVKVALNHVMSFKQKERIHELSKSHRAQRS